MSPEGVAGVEARLQFGDTFGHRGVDDVGEVADAGLRHVRGQVRGGPGAVEDLLVEVDRALDPAATQLCLAGSLFVTKRATVGMVWLWLLAHANIPV
jgi:hypothetical protein